MASLVDERAGWASPKDRAVEYALAVLTLAVRLGDAQAEIHLFYLRESVDWPTINVSSEFYPPRWPRLGDFIWTSSHNPTPQPPSAAAGAPFLQFPARHSVLEAQHVRDETPLQVTVAHVLF